MYTLFWFCSTEELLLLCLDGLGRCWSVDRGQLRSLAALGSLAAWNKSGHPLGMAMRGARFLRIRELGEETLLLGRLLLMLLIVQSNIFEGLLGRRGLPVKGSVSNRRPRHTRKSHRVETVPGDLADDNWRLGRYVLELRSVLPLL